MAASHVLRALARRPVAGSAALAGTSLAAGAVANPDSDGVHFVNRFAEASKAFLPMYFVDYLGHVRRCAGKRDDEEHMWKSRQIMWTGVATRLRDLCKKNGGIYVKAGQHICVQPVSPAPFQTILRTLMDSAGVRPFEEDRATFYEDLGVDIEDAFASIDPTPVASASLAQVYKATTHGGETVAVKIQQRPVARFLAIDLATIDAYYSLLSFLIPGLRFQWLANETRRHMAEELDFREEAKNAERARALMAKDFDDSTELHVPRVHDTLSGARVLTQEWCDGARIDDKEGLRARGVDRRELATLVNRIFGRMTFVHGYVHCDPHPGNLLVDSNGRVVLLDHGVYRSLDDRTRRTWCKLWRGLIANDDAEMRAAVADLGVDPELTTFFRIVLALVPARVVEDVHGTSTSAVISPGGGGGTGEVGSVDGGGDVQVAARSGNPDPKPGLAGFSGGVDKLSSFGKREVMRDVLGVKVERQTELFETLPRDLLMILKANNLLRFVNEQLDSPVNRFRSIAAAAEEGIAVNEAIAAEGILERKARDRNGGGRRIFGDGSRSSSGWSYGAQVGAMLLPLQLAMMKGKLGFTMWRRAREEAKAAMQGAKRAGVSKAASGGGTAGAGGEPAMT